MGKVRLLVFSIVAALVFAGCQTVILRQDIPVTTNPMGAKIFANGRSAGQTPATVSLERTKDHVITVVKDGFRQEDVMIRRQYQSDKVFMKALQSGINAGTLSKDAGTGMNRGFASVEEQEKTGEAYILVPAMVKIKLTPLSGVPAAEPPETNRETPPPPRIQANPDGSGVTEK